MYTGKRWLTSIASETVFHHHALQTLHYCLVYGGYPVTMKKKARLLISIIYPRNSCELLHISVLSV